MPLGGSTISWDATPAGSESIGLGDDRIRSMKTSIASGLDNEHNWPALGGANTGYHRLGSARAHVGTQSRVSSGDTDGRLMITSDSSRLFGVGSAGTQLLGGALMLSIDSSSYISWPQRARWAGEVGQAFVGAGNRVVVTFPNSGFSTTPFIVAQPSAASVTGSWDVKLWYASSSEFSAGIYDEAGVGVSNQSFDWFAIGYRVL